MDIELFKILSEYPYIYNETFYNSNNLQQNKTCLNRCTEKDCLDISKYETNKYICKKGYNNILISLGEELYILNGLIFNSNNKVPKGRKDARKDWIVKDETIANYVQKLINIENYLEQDFNQSMIKNLSMFHDFKSSMNIFYDCTQDIIHSFEGDNFEDKLKNSDPVYTDLYNALDLITSQLGMIDVISNPQSISFGTKKEISTYKLFDKLRHLLKHNRVARKKNIKIEIVNKNNKYIENSLCYDTIEFIPLILLDNAIKYSSENSIIVIELTQLYKKVRVKVKNIGPFVKDENINKIFNKFYRGKTGGEYTSQGLGVGLWIAQEILKIHNSYIKYDKDTNATGDIGLNIFEFELETL